MLCLVEARRLAPILAAAALTGCAGGSLTAPPMPADSSTAFSAVRSGAQFYGNDYVYSAQLYGNDATVYARKGLSLTPLETLYPGIAAPQGTIVTPNGWWYLANGGDANVLIYRSTRKGPNGPVGSLDDSGEVPDNVSVTGDRNLVAVSNAVSAGSGTGSVSVYVNRESRPSRILSYGSDQLAGQGVAIDPQGNCYWSFNDVSSPSKVGSIVGFANCSGAGSPVVSGIVSAGGMAFDHSGNLYYVDEAAGIYKCQKTSSCKLLASGFGLPTNINFDSKQKHLWVADATGYIDAVNPQTGKIEFQTISVGGDPYGIAPSPGS
ncbi:MAG: hypothetical protein JO113_07305 [Candidatus Eremiobacteraeota bacterium]|nr:hypothetical protein [Candidatus Eremiobacteraeota bacterium]